MVSCCYSLSHSLSLSSTIWYFHFQHKNAIDYVAVILNLKTFAEFIIASSKVSVVIDDWIVILIWSLVFALARGVVLWTSRFRMVGCVFWYSRRYEIIVWFVIVSHRNGQPSWFQVRIRRYLPHTLTTLAGGHECFFPCPHNWVPLSKRYLKTIKTIHFE